MTRSAPHHLLWCLNALISRRNYPRGRAGSESSAHPGVGGRCAGTRARCGVDKCPSRERLRDTDSRRHRAAGAQLTRCSAWEAQAGGRFYVRRVEQGALRVDHDLSRRRSLRRPRVQAGVEKLWTTPWEPSLGGKWRPVVALGRDLRFNHSIPQRKLGRRPRAFVAGGSRGEGDPMRGPRQTRC